MSNLNVFLDGNDELHPENIHADPDLIKYTVKKYKRPKIILEKKENKIIISRKDGLFKPKQVFVFPTFIEKGFDVLATNFLLFYRKFIEQEETINSTQYLTDLKYLFEASNIFILPRVTPYILEKMTANNHMYIRFITMVNSLETLINPDVIKFVEYCYLRAVIRFNASYFIPNEKNDYNIVAVKNNHDAIHEYLDMLVLFPWSYLFFVYKFNKYSDLRSIINLNNNTN